MRKRKLPERNPLRTFGERVEENDWRREFETVSVAMSGAKRFELGWEGLTAIESAGET